MPRASPIVRSMLQYTRSLTLHFNTRLFSKPMRRIRCLQIKDRLCDGQMHLHRYAVSNNSLAAELGTYGMHRINATSSNRPTAGQRGWALGYWTSA